MAIQIDLEVLPFTGFYGGVWDQSENEYVQTRELKYGDYEEIESLQFLDDWGFAPDYRDQIAKMFADAYCSKLQEMLGLDVKLVGAWVRSPQYYNYSTDEIYATFEVEDYDALVKRVCHFVDKPEYRTKLANIIKERHSSRDGFWSFMSNDIEEWYGLICNPDDDKYISYLIGYLLEIVDPDWFATLNDDMYRVAMEYGLQETYPSTPEAKEEFEIYKQYREVYTKWAGAHPRIYKNPNKNSYPNFIVLEWEDYKKMWLEYITEYELEQKRKALMPVIPGLFDDETDISLT